MLRTQVIGCGAAGNKAVIDLVDSGLISKDHMSFLLVNSTDKDITPSYRTNSMIFGGSNVGGCGKERELGKRMILHDHENGIRSIDRKIDPYAQFVIVCGSTEGGSGSASVPIISKYIKQVLHIPVVAVLFFGFNDDARGMQNSIEICQELPEDIAVISICNSKFISEANGNKFKAEKLANKRFCEICRMLVGGDIIESDQNIDDTDLIKIVTTPGYMNVEKIYLKGIKNVEQFDKLVTNAIDSSTSMSSPEPSAKRIAAIFNAKRDADYIDYSCGVFKKRYGIPYELFVHSQEIPDTNDSVYVIVSGQKLPLDEVKDIYEEYNATSEAVNKDKDDFFSTMNQLKGNPEDSMFNMFQNIRIKTPNEADKAQFFKDFGIGIPSTPEKKGKANPNVKDVGEY